MNLVVKIKSVLKTDFLERLSNYFSFKFRRVRVLQFIYALPRCERGRGSLMAGERDGQCAICMSAIVIYISFTETPIV